MSDRGKTEQIPLSLKQSGRRHVVERDAQMLVSQGPSAQADNHIFLVGRPPIQEFLGFVGSQTVGGQDADQRALANEWRQANDHIRELEQKESGYADQPVLTPLDESLRELEQKVLADPILQKSFQMVPTDIATVELDRLVVFQKSINTRFVEELKSSLGTKPTQEAVLRFCLPYDHPTPPVRAMQIAQNAYSFISQSMDFRPIGQAVLLPHQVVGYQANGVLVGVVGLAVGYGSNYLNAVMVDGRLVLNNGSHRAFALRDMGITHAPCLVQHVSRRDELPAVAAGELVENPERYLEGTRPPVLKDYFDPKLRKLVSVPRKLRQVRVSIGVEQSDVPG